MPFCERPESGAGRERSGSRDAPAALGRSGGCPELLERHAPTTLISDNMMGTLFAQGEIRKLCFFYDNAIAEGPSGICGSLLAVRLARLHGVPVELFSGDACKCVPTPDNDVSTFLGQEDLSRWCFYSPLEAKSCPGRCSRIRSMTKL